MAVVLRDITNVKNSRNKAGAFLIVFLPLTVWTFMHYQGWWRMSAVLPLAVTLVSFKFFYAYYSGYKMESKITEILKGLPGEVYVLHDLVFRRDDKKTKISHLAVTQRGIFCIETRHRQGRIVDEGEKWHHYWVNEHNVIDSPVNIAVASADTLRDIIREGAAEIFGEGDFAERLFIQPVVAFSNDKVELRLMSSKVPVFRLKEFESYMNSFRKRVDLTPETREKLAQYLLRHGHPK